MIQYGGAIRNLDRNAPQGDLRVLRDGATVTIEVLSRHAPDMPPVATVRLSYAALLQLVARLSEAAKDAARGSS